MNDERNMTNNPNVTGNTVHDQCVRLQYFHVVIQLSHGNIVEGIIEGVDDNQVIVLVPEDVEERENENRQFGYGYGHRPRRRFRRFRRRFFPIPFISSIAPYPYPFQPFPYPFPYYPYF